MRCNGVLNVCRETGGDCDGDTDGLAFGDRDGETYGFAEGLALGEADGDQSASRIPPSI